MVWLSGLGIVISKVGMDIPSTTYRGHHLVRSTGHKENRENH